MAKRLLLEDMEERIDCFGEFDREDTVCLCHCSLNFECAAARERYQQMLLREEAFDAFGVHHSA